MSPRPRKLLPKSQFARRLNILIGEQNISDFESLTSLSNGSVRNYLKGSSPKIEAIQAICLATGCDANWLVLGKGEPFPDK